MHQHNLLGTSGGGSFTALLSSASGYTQLSATTTGDVASFLAGDRRGG